MPLEHLLRSVGAFGGELAHVERPPVVPPEAPLFVQQVTAMMMAGRGDELPVSALPIDGTYPVGDCAVGEAQHFRHRAGVEARNLHPMRQLCDGLSSLLRFGSRYYDESALALAPPGFASARLAGRGFPNLRFTIAGCGRRLHRM